MKRPTAFQRALTIEKALHWAYQQELVNVDPRQVSPMFVERVHGGGGGPGYEEGAISRIVAADALAIGDAVQALAATDWSAGVAFPPITYAVDGMSMADKPYIDAALLKVETLIICHAKLGTRPYCEDTPEPTALRAGNGRPEVRRLAMVEEHTAGGADVAFEREMIAKEERARVRDRAGVYELGSYCVLQWYPTVEAVMRDRADYVVWRGALAWLRDRLDGALERTAITEGLPAERPWFN